MLHQKSTTRFADKTSYFDRTIHWIHWCYILLELLDLLITSQPLDLLMLLLTCQLLHPLMLHLTYQPLGRWCYIWFHSLDLLLIHLTISGSIHFNMFQPNLVRILLDLLMLCTSNFLTTGSWIGKFISSFESTNLTEPSIGAGPFVRTWFCHFCLHDYDNIIHCF